MAVLALAVPLALPASAQTLQRLHVRSFTLTGDTANPKIETPFTITLTIRVAERVNRLDNVFLPSFMGAEELGDVRALAQNANGTTYRETMRLVAHASGPLTIGSAYLDAVDARDGKPKRFISNGLRLNVAGVTAFDFGPLIGAAQLLFGIAVIGALAYLLFKRRREPVPQPVRVQPEAQPAVQPPPEPSLESALAQLRTRRDRASVLQVRMLLWETLGAQPGQTLGDVLNMRGAGDARTRRLLLSVERAAFIEENRLHSAIEDIV